MPQPPPQRTIHAAFEAQARRTPAAAAIVCAVTGKELTYAELDYAASALAQHLRMLVDQRGGTSGGMSKAPCCAVLLPSSRERMVGYYACLKAGLSFCPLEAGWPPAVCRSALDLVQPAVLLVQADSEGEAARGYCAGAGVPVACVADAYVGGVAEMHENITAHIIFTSGSSGAPKAVLCGHSGSLLSHAVRVSPSAPSERFGCAVFGVWDAVAAHLCGGVAVMVPDEALRDAETLAVLIATNDIDRMLITPTLLDTLLVCAAARASLSLLTSLTLCGELPSASAIARASQLLPPTVSLINLYSSCECHDVALAV